MIQLPESLKLSGSFSYDAMKTLWIFHFVFLTTAATL